VGREEVAFFDQPVVDQRHGYMAAGLVARRFPDRPELVRAALLHDLGKRHARLGVVGRSLVTGLAKMGLKRLVNRRGGRADLYLRHGELAASELSELGAEPLVIAFARSHHTRRPPEIDAGDWAVLVSADR
jgi:putative nucleotidyltransferase with HDIG domain